MLTLSDRVFPIVVERVFRVLGTPGQPVFFGVTLGLNYSYFSANDTVPLQFRYRIVRSAKPGYYLQSVNRICIRTIILYVIMVILLGNDDGIK